MFGNVSSNISLYRGVLNMANKIFILLVSVLSTLSIAAQNNKILDDGIASLQVVAGTDWLSLPIIRLGGTADTDVINIGFDDLTHEYRRLTYSIEHCETDWSKSEYLFASDYIEGFADGNTIDDSQQSVNTNTQYTHYSLQIPNERCLLKLSGNYRLRVYDDDNNGREVLSACFMVVEPLTAVGLTVSSNTDIDVNKAHQQVSLRVDYGSLNVTRPEQIKTIVMQNRRTDNAVSSPKPQYVTPSGMVWEHCRALIFPAGNEYHKFEVLDVSHLSMGVERTEWTDGQYQVYPFVCETRPAYLYDEDADGAFYIRNSDNIANDTESDYVNVHYKLKADEPFTGRLYVNGAWTNNHFTPEYELTYDPREQCYSATVRQKLGYYSYQFVLRDADGRSIVSPTEGSYWQTENTYQALVYFRGNGERTDRLVGYAQTQFKAD